MWTFAFIRGESNALSALVARNRPLRFAGGCFSSLREIIRSPNGVPISSCAELAGAWYDSGRRVGYRKGRSKHAMSSEDWSLIESGQPVDYRIFQIRRDRYWLKPANAERDFVVLDTPDWVNVVPRTVEGNVVLIRQFRHGVRETVIEIPGGMIDQGEEPAAAALRELGEETGYTAERIRPLAAVWANPAIMNNRCHLFLAEGCRWAAPPRFDSFEQIEVFEASPGEVTEMVASGRIAHSMVVAALALAGMVRSIQ